MRYLNNTSSLRNEYVIKYVKMFFYFNMIKMIKNKNQEIVK